MSSAEPVRKRSGRLAYIWIMVVATLVAGAAFVLKIAEFLHTLESPDADGFITVPIVVYFLVAAGYGFLLAWAWAKGDFRRIEEPKYEMLERELEYEQLEKQGLEP